MAAAEHSFDVVSDYDAQELTNALDQTRREISQRYDFKGATAQIDRAGEALVLLASSDLHLKAMVDVLQSKFHRRGIDIRVLDAQPAEAAARGNLRQELRLRRGIDDELARSLSKRIRAGQPKVQVRIQGDQLRVAARDKDLLQAVIRDLRSMDLDRPLQFTNYR